MQDVKGIVAQMTLEEKAALVTGATTWSTTPVERLGVPQMIMTDGPHGIRRTKALTDIAAASLPATAYPTAVNMACTWDVEALAEVGRAIAEEAKALGVDLVLGPGVNMKRTPLCGRNFEYYSEDPYLAGALGVAYIQGVQSQGIGTSLKHYAANNQEYARNSINAVIDERTLREIYLAAFEMCVRQAQPWSVMCAYNRLNGEYCSEHHWLLTKVLKEEWGLKGLVVSDWGAVHDRVKALQGGLDLEMPGPRPRRTQQVVEAVRTGALDEAVLDESVHRILAVVAKAEQSRAASAETPALDIEGHHALARRVAAEGMVLLKNEDILPITRVEKLAVIGRAAQKASFQGGGSSHINPTRLDIPLEELQNLLPDSEISSCLGYHADESFDQGLIDEAVALARQSDVTVLYVALPPSKESEGYDRPDMKLTEQQVALIRAVGAVQPKTVVVLNNGSAIEMGAWVDSVAAVLEAWLPGQAGGGAIADVLTGRVNPCGKLAETFPVRLEDTPAYLNFPGENGVVRYGEGVHIGYRYYDMRQMDVQYPFGYGLSYTTFAYTDLQVSSNTFRDVDGLTVRLQVTNTGSVAGKEVVQLYVQDKQSSLSRPPKELKGFAKVHLEPGETKQVEFSLDARAFSCFHPGYAQWVAEAGEFVLLVGASSRDIRLTAEVTLESTASLPSLLNLDSTISEWLQDARGKVVAGPLLDQILTGLKAAFSGAGEADNSLGEGLDVSSFLMEMPLVGLLSWQEEQLPQTPREIVEGLLAAVRA